MRDCFYKYATETVSLSNFLMSFESGCNRCSLCKDSKKIIIYKGNPDADILLLGEAPGMKEEEQGEPFVGPAGKLLDKILEPLEFGPEKIFFTNCVFCRPVSKEEGKQNYTPLKDQLETCWPFVENLIKIIKPKIIIACGRTALSMLTKENNIKVTDYEGTWISYKETPVFVMIHPASILYKMKDNEEFEKIKEKVKKYIIVFKETYKEKMEKK